MSTVDSIDIQYLRLKMDDIVRSVRSDATTVSVALEFFDVMADSTYLSQPTLREPTPELFIEIIEDLAAISSIPQSHACRTLQYPIDILLGLATKITIFGCVDIAGFLYDTAEDVIRNLLAHGVGGYSPDDLLFWLGWVTQEKINLATSELDQGVLIAELTRIRRIQLHGTSVRRLRLAHALLWSSATGLHAGDYDSSAQSCDEALNLLNAAIHPYSELAVCDDNDLQLGLLQAHAYALYLLAHSLALSGQYTQAYFTGMDCIFLIQNLASSPDAPRDFYPMTNERVLIEESISSWTSIVRGPSMDSVCAPVERCGRGGVEEGLAEMDVEFEWGIAC
ncbi:hypothetical protein ONZ45_g16416 [Pleurotus djamor]|nr:hypothetical protein ONZ45_g16416 [Pleurotus djamor]